jgi:hypothetical protein
VEFLLDVGDDFFERHFDWWNAFGLFKKKHFNF